MKHAKFFGFHGDELRFLPGEGGGWTVFRPRQSPKSRTPVFFSGTSLSLALSIILEDIGEQMWVNAALFVLCKTPDSLHQVRVSLRRLGSFCTLSKMLPAPPALLKEVVELDLKSRTLSSSLAPARDWEIFFQSVFPKMRKQFSKPEEQTILYLLAKKHEKKADRKARNSLNSFKFKKTLLEIKSLTKKFSHLDDCESIDFFRSRALLSIEKKVQERSCTGQSRKKAHRLRIALKTFRYVSEFFSGIKTKEEDGADPKSILSALDQLGEVNDLYSLRRRFMKIRKDEKSGKRRMVMDNFIKWIRRKEKKRLLRIEKLSPLQSLEKIKNARLPG